MGLSLWYQASHLSYQSVCVFRINNDVFVHTK